MVMTVVLARRAQFWEEPITLTLLMRPVYLKAATTEKAPHIAKNSIDQLPLALVPPLLPLPVPPVRLGPKAAC